MARICVLPSAELGHLYPTLRLAGDLAARGHEVVYATPPAYVELLRARGFAVDVIWGDWFTDEFDRTRAVGSEQARTEAWKKFIDLEMDLMLGDQLEAKIRAGGYDVILSDDMMPVGPMIAWALGLPCVQYTVCAPIDVAPPGPERDAQIQGSIERHRRSDLEFVEMCPRIVGFTARLAARYGYDERWIQDGDWCIGSRCTTAEQFLIMCPPDLLTDPEVSRRFEFCQSLPKPPAGPWRPRALECKRICISFGSNGARYPNGSHVVSALVGAMAELPEFHLLALGLPEAMAREHGDLDNVEFIGWAPQRELLEQGVRLMCSHGGLGTYKECVYHGVPLLITPFSFDQPTNTRFIEAVGVGVAIDSDAPTERIRATFREVLSSEACAATSAAVAERVRRFEREETGADLVERALR